MAEDKVTVMAKSHNTLAIDGRSHRPAPTLVQQGRNAGGSIAFALRQAVRSLTGIIKRVRFKRDTTTVTFRSEDEAFVVTYDSGADGNYISEADRKKAGLPILYASTRRVGVANGGESIGKYRTRLPIPNLSPTAAEADSFEDFPTSLVSVGAVADGGNVSIFTKEVVKVYAEHDVLITCQGSPIMIGKRDDCGRYRIPLMQERGQWQPRRPSKRAKQALERAHSVYDLPSIEQAIKWMHAVCGYPVKSTWLKAVKAGN